MPNQLSLQGNQLTAGFSKLTAWGFRKYSKLFVTLHVG